MRTTALAVGPGWVPGKEFLRKQVLVTVARGETKVGILEADGTPAAEENEKKSGGGRSSRAKRDDSSAGRSQNGSEPNWRVGELYVERRGSRSIVGNVYKGKVDNVLPGLEAAFVDIGLEKNGFLHADDVVIPRVEVARRS